MNFIFCKLKKLKEHECHFLVVSFSMVDLILRSFGIALFNMIHDKKVLLFVRARGMRPLLTQSILEDPDSADSADDSTSGTTNFIPPQTTFFLMDPKWPKKGNFHYILSISENIRRNMSFGIKSTQLMVNVMSQNSLGTFSKTLETIYNMQKPGKLKIDEKTAYSLEI